MNHATRNALQSVPFVPGYLVVGENGKARQHWLNTSPAHFANNLVRILAQHDPFVRNGSLVASYQEDDNGSRTVRYRR
jgi:hypothetical protein